MLRVLSLLVSKGYCLSMTAKSFVENIPYEFCRVVERSGVGSGVIGSGVVRSGVVRSGVVGSGVVRSGVVEGGSVRSSLKAKSYNVVRSSVEAKSCNVVRSGMVKQ